VHPSKVLSRPSARFPLLNVLTIFWEMWKLHWCLLPLTSTQQRRRAVYTECLAQLAAFNSAYMGGGVNTLLLSSCPAHASNTSSLVTNILNAGLPVAANAVQFSLRAVFKFLLLIFTMTLKKRCILSPHWAGFLFCVIGVVTTGVF
jgi:hypothetical protein